MKYGDHWSLGVNLLRFFRGLILNELKGNLLLICTVL